MAYYDEPTAAPEPTNAQILTMLQQLGKTIRALAAHVGMDPVLLLVEPADDRDLDSEWGNPLLDRAPKNWTGEALEGRHFSDLQPATLRALARHYASLAEWHDSKNNVDAKGRPKSGYARRDAARALGWALRLEQRGHRGPRRPQHREEVHPPVQEQIPATSDDDIPFLAGILGVTEEIDRAWSITPCASLDYAIGYLLSAADTADGKKIP